MTPETEPDFMRLLMRPVSAYTLVRRASDGCLFRAWPEALPPGCVVVADAPLDPRYWALPRLHHGEVV